MTDFSEAAEELVQAEAKLVDQVVAACEDPSKHKPQQHRDGKPPWCGLCGRTRRGQLVGTPKSKLIAPADYTREVLIDLCEKGIVNFNHWTDRDSSGAQQQLGKGWALLKAGVPFIVLDGTNHPHRSESHLKTDQDTIWVHFDFPGFNAFEMGRDQDDGYWDDETAYIPTQYRLDKWPDKDWY